MIIGFEASDQEVALIDELKERCGHRTRREVFVNAIKVFGMVVGVQSKGHRIAFLKEGEPPEIVYFVTATDQTFIPLSQTTVS